MKHTSIVPHIKQLVPSFIAEDHQLFISFVEAYHEWLEQADQPIDLLYQIEQLQDIDTSVDRFFEYFRQEYMNSIPSDIATDKALTLKHISDLYRSKGTKKSVELLFRILFGEQHITIEYPNERVLKPSDGVWDQGNELTTTTTNLVDNFDTLVGKQIYGQSSGIFAIVERVRKVTRQSGTVLEIEYSGNSDLRKLFEAGETVSFINDDTADFTVNTSEQLSGYFRDTRGFLDNINVLQDGEKYQNYSYVIESKQNFDDYKELVRNTVHPAGMYLGGIKKTETGTLNTSQQLQTATVTVTSLA